MFDDKIVLLRGGGDIATGIAYVLYNAGFKIIITEISKPSAIRRTVAFCDAIYNGKQVVENITCIKVNNVNEAKGILSDGNIPILVDEKLDLLKEIKPDILIDSILAKKNLGTNIDMADLVIGVGPGFTAKIDCHYVIETMRGHNLARVISEGQAQANTGVPGLIANHGKDRVIHAENDGIIRNVKSISDNVKTGDIIAYIDDNPVKATIDGILRGIIIDGYEVTKGLKIADIDPRESEKNNCFTISDKARAIGGGVLMAILYHYNM